MGPHLEAPAGAILSLTIIVITHPLILLQNKRASFLSHFFGVIPLRYWDIVVLFRYEAVDK
jgi:hypothetical protein